MHVWLIFSRLICRHVADLRHLQRHNTANSKQIFPEKEFRGHSANFHINQVSMSHLYIPTIDLSFLLQENIWTRSWEYINKLLT